MCWCASNLFTYYRIPGYHCRAMPRSTTWSNLSGQLRWRSISSSSLWLIRAVRSSDTLFKFLLATNRKISDVILRFHEVVGTSSAYLYLKLVWKIGYEIKIPQLAPQCLTLTAIDNLSHKVKNLSRSFTFLAEKFHRKLFTVVGKRIYHKKIPLCRHRLIN